MTLGESYSFLKETRSGLKRTENIPSFLELYRRIFRLVDATDRLSGKFRSKLAITKVTRTRTFHRTFHDVYFFSFFFADLLIMRDLMPLIQSQAYLMWCKFSDEVMKHHRRDDLLRKCYDDLSKALCNPTINDNRTKLCRFYFGFLFSV